MSITSINGNSSLTTSLLSGITSSSNPFDTTSGSTSSTPSTDGAGRFATAIKNAFASLGISLDANSSTSSSTASTSTSSSSDASSTDTPSTDAVSAFLQSLFAALHSQSSGSTPPPDGPPPADGTDASTTAVASTTAASSTTASSSTDASTQTAAHVGRAHHHHGGKVEADLKSLISELTSSSSSSTDATTADSSTGVTATGSTATSATTSTDPALATLEKNFDALLAQSGSSTTASSTSTSDTLAAFLQSLASNLHGAPATGNVVSTTA